MGEKTYPTSGRRSTVRNEGLPLARSRFTRGSAAVRGRLSVYPAECARRAGRVWRRLKFATKHPGEDD